MGHVSYVVLSQHLLNMHLVNVSKVTPIHFEYKSDEVGVCHFFTKLVAVATKRGQDRSSDLQKTVDCTACRRLRRPYQGSIRCSSTSSDAGSGGDVTTTSRGGDVTLTCTVTCRGGYAFSGAVLDQYVCGPDTGYLWPHESPDNPRALLPACTGQWGGHFYRATLC